MAQPLRNLTPRHHRAIALRLAGETPASIATTLGVKRRTVYVWFSSPLMKEELRLRLRQVDDLIVQRLAAQALSPEHGHGAVVARGGSQFPRPTNEARR